MSLNSIEQLIYDAADSGNTDLINSMYNVKPSGSFNLNKRNPNAVSVDRWQFAGVVTDSVVVGHLTRLAVGESHSVDDRVIQGASRDCEATGQAWCTNLCSRFHGMMFILRSRLVAESHSCPSS